MNIVEWGIRPILFSVCGFDIPSYSFFVALGLLAGILVYYLEARKQNVLNENSQYIVLGSLVGGVIGAKLLELLINVKYFPAIISIDNLFFGKTIIGGLIGGFIGVRIVKKILNITEKKGNIFAPAVALGVGIGRMGCFLRGCCYGKATNLPWGVDFGDGVLRHPTQIYELIFMLGMFIYLELIKDKVRESGKLFKILMISYFVFRFFIEFIRVEEVAFFGLTAFQIISIIAIIYLLRDNIIKLIKKYGTR